jgi:multidrug efflux pump subunit AcrA (membrane-fusion protein)
MNHVNIFASEDGVVMKRPLSDRISSPGEVVANGDIVLSLGVMRSIMLAAQVPQEKIESVYLGQKAEIVFDSYPSLVLLGQVQKIDPQTDPQTRTFKAYIKVDAKPMPTGKKGTVSGLGVVPLDSSAKKGEVDYLASKLGAQPPPTQETAGSSPSKIPELKLTPGLSAYARLQHKRTMLTVPRLAVVKNAGESSVFVVENSTAHLRRIRTGVELSRNVEVLSGLKAGDQVVYYGLLALKDNDPVNLQALGNADEVQESNRRGK